MKGSALGHEFLAHLERARLIVHVIDAPRTTSTSGSRRSTRSSRLRRGPRRAFAGDRPEQDRPAPRAARVGEPRPARGAHVPRSPARPGPGWRSSSSRCSSSAPPSPRRPSPRAASCRSSSSTGRSRAPPRLPDLPHRPRLPRRRRAPAEEELEAALKAAGARKGDVVEVGGEELELS